ncbi:MAG: hypothetical protein CFH30_01024 [Alphaproteobacteria bacterium MarineAlpha8_Bin1]|nr:MAG: hypothetical protein CFH30_01024 [Alphaproteobacteria bacterium MarineAlpha8_Bin1]|tara:strand:+ start:102 stop:632 length:531 start_codon:yes stop_codon:yes gene_type:complete
MSDKFLIKSPLELELRDINEICILKDQHWPLGLKKQFGLWFIITNQTDKLFLLKKNQKVISFLRLKLRQLLVDKTVIDSFYLTEVCVDKKFQNIGWGKKIMQISQDFIEKKNMSSYLICNSDQQKFYTNLGWEPSKNINYSESLKSTKKKISKNRICFFYNLKNEDKRVTLIGKLF